MNQIAVDMDKVNAALDIISTVTGISREIICAQDRHKDHAAARFMAYHVLKEYCGLSYYRIGKLLNKTHPAVMHGVKVTGFWDESNRFRDKESIRNWETLKQIINKLTDEDLCSDNTTGCER